MTTKRFLLPLIPLLASAATPVDHPAHSPISGPVLGYVYDSSAGALRVMRGIPGAAVVEAPAAAGVVTLAVISPRNDIALAVSAGDGLLRMVTLGGKRAVETVVNGALPSPDRIVFSPSGTAALLWSQAQARFQEITGLPGSPAVADVEFSGAPDAVAITDDGATVLISSGGAVTVWQRGAVPISLPFSAAVAVFRGGASDALAVSPSGDVYLLRNGGRQWNQIRPGDASTQTPVGVRWSDDGALGYVASAGGTLSVVNLSSGESTSISCHCAPTAMEPVAARSIFRVTGPSSSPVWLFDASQPVPGLWFAPVRSGQ